MRTGTLFYSGFNFNSDIIIMNKLSINGESKRYGIIGYPLKHTLSPQMHNGLFEKLNINAFYFPFEISPEKFEKTVPFLKSLFSGFNVTVPFKESILPFLDGVCEKSLQIGAVNTVFFREGKWVGTNTDWKGFAENVEEDYHIRFKDKNVLILGAGGASRACMFTALWKGAKKIVVSNRTLSKAEEMIRQVSSSVELSAIGVEEQSLKQAGAEADIILNTTSIGLLKDDIHYMNLSTVRKDAFAYDLIYSRETDFIRKAKSLGLKTGNGKGMLIRQGRYAFEAWTGILPDTDFMCRFAGFERLDE